MVRLSTTNPEQELIDFPWEKVTYHLDENGDFNVNQEIRNTWEKYGFFVVKNLFTEETMKCAEECSKDPYIQSNLQPRTDEDGYNMNFLLWNNCDNGLIGACTRCEKVINPFEQLLGGEVYHYHTKLALKDPNGGGGFNWHQDYGYWYKNGCLAPDLATLWLPMDKVDQENGCLKVIPGSHRLGRIEHKSVNNQVTADEERMYHLLKKLGFVYVSMDKGDGLFFHCNLLHSSDANWSQKRRWAIISSYNTRENDPVYKHHHPNYYFLPKLKNSDVKSFHGKFATDYKFQCDNEDKSLKSEYGIEDRVVKENEIK